MTAPLTPRHMLAELVAQHASLRGMIDRCEQLADGLDASSVEPAQLVTEVAQLRIAFDAHNQLEERLLDPVLIDAGWRGAVRVSRMIEDHVEEHRALRRELDTSISAELREVLANLRTHLDTEERYLLTPKVLRDDLVR
jgi:iron-sulfur cluster repair protein YtfE (RIC family)